MDRIAVLIPCFNESGTIHKVVSDFRRVLPEAEVYVYDNNSTDGTDKIAASAGAVVRYEYEQGKGNVIRRMFMETDAECYILVDGDDTYPADSAKKMADLVLEKNADMVVGDRLSSTYAKVNKRPFHNFGNFALRSAINRMYGSDIKDVMTGYRALSYRFVKTFPVLSRGFEIETEMTIHAIDKNLSVRNVIINYRGRQEGSDSKLNTYADGFKVIRTVLSLYRLYKPLAFFGIISAALFVLAAVFFIPVLATYIKTGLVPDFPTLIVCGFVVLAAVQSFFAGLILQTICRKNRQDFEMQLHGCCRKIKKPTSRRRL